MLHAHQDVTLTQTVTVQMLRAHQDVTLRQPVLSASVACSPKRDPDTACDLVQVWHAHRDVTLTQPVT